MKIALQSINFPDRFVRHANFLGELTPVVNQLDRSDATFSIVAASSDSRLVSFRSHNFGGHVLRHRDFRVRLDDVVTPAEDATFIMTPGLADETATSFRSANFPDRFLRHRDFHLFLEPISNELDRADATFRIVPGFLPDFTFDGGISAPNRDKLIERHRVALASIAPCGRLSGDEKVALHEAYRRTIHHTTLNQAGVNASATVNGSTVNVNFGVLFPQGDEEISQTLIHEMMHCAGFKHPKRRDAPAGKSCADPAPRTFDCPNDDGQYYGTPPLRSEFCIAGDQSDVEARLERKTLEESCVIDDDGVATMFIRNGA